MIRLLPIVLAMVVTFAATPAAAQVPSTNDTRQIPVRAAYVLREGERFPLDTEPPHPGEVIGLRLDWPENIRIETALVAPRSPIEQVVPLQLLLEDPQTENADVVEVLLLGLGEVEIPEILVRSRLDGETYSTAPVKIMVEPALAEEDTEPAPAKHQAEIGLNYLGVAVWVLLALLVIGSLIAWWLIRRKRASLPRPALVKPEIPADIWAQRALRTLLSSSLIKDGRLKEFQIRLAEISKEYLSRRFHVPLKERTTTECPDELRDAGVDAGTCDEVGRWLFEIDMVKFAGEWRSTDQIDASVKALQQMIDRTRPSLRATGEQDQQRAVGSGG